MIRVFTFLLCFVPSIATAQILCKPTEDTFKLLKQKFQEHPAWFGTAQNGKLIVRFEKEDGSTWTLIVIDANKGEACFMASGDWSRNVPKKKGEGL